LEFIDFGVGDDKQDKENEDDKENEYDIYS
jgi:hypothetical protein